eukprot:CAMPEP_0198323568 /NCGR_PEP_ID=MMETSP1450-20131203/11776_1 /TAXON_ID=753684 ORGANISM="Madagascaria erythrocladiodes, Strain CCMP3234" /NCGR_SAMPLE_ID=MMETSP1450 /ASSEMBLY_ACC=CAM_ASM_001115 /LENGTH=748 /DNA_ID=CAMNT_0044027285 /DNA_START=56 /DNA_END=2305 /DNA_ORIENTATION=-
MEVDDCVSRVEIHIEASSLRDMDIIGKSDPFAVLYTRLPETSGGAAPPTAAPRPTRRNSSASPALAAGFTPLGTTETIPNNLNPKFATSITCDYFFERQQLLLVELYDRDGKTDNLAKHDFLGAAEILLAQLVAAPGQRATLPLHDRRRRRVKGAVTLLVEEVAGLKRAVTLGLAVPKIKVGIASPPLAIRLLRAREGGEWAVVYTSPPVRKAAGGYALQRFKVTGQKLNNGDPARPLRMEVWTGGVGVGKMRGYAETTEADMLRDVAEDAGTPKPGKAPIPIRLKGKDVGEVVVTYATSTQEPTFLDYIFGGCEISLVMAIDFTASNGDPRKTGSLHYNDPSGPNEYEAAIRAVTQILGPYDSDQKIPAYGYGARLPPQNTVSHCFALNGNPSDAECDGLDGVLTAYRQALNAVVLSGPTVFSQILQLASSMAGTHSTQDSQSFTILLIITDGIISDMEATISEIVRASDLPMSIVIVGVGGADFQAMERLDADDVPLVSNGKTMKRDIVQFVPFRKFKAVPSLLAAEVLAEIPDQLLSYMNSHKIRPNEPRQAVPAANNVDDLRRAISSLNRTNSQASNTSGYQSTLPTTPTTADRPAVQTAYLPAHGGAVASQTYLPSYGVDQQRVSAGQASQPTFTAEQHRPSSSVDPYASFLAGGVPVSAFPVHPPGSNNVSPHSSSSYASGYPEPAPVLGSAPSPVSTGPSLDSMQKRNTSEYIPKAYPEPPIPGEPTHRYPSFPINLPPSS